MPIQISGYSDKGTVRKDNEDRYLYFQTDYGAAAIVCDGMGGYKGGEIAASIATEVISEHFINLTGNFDPEKEINYIFNKANESILKRSTGNKELTMMGTTATLLLIINERFITAHVGDSRVYLIRNNTIRLLTRDHTHVQMLMDKSNITYEQAVLQTDRNVITRVLGINEISKPEISVPEQLNPGDKLILCTDGLSNFLNNEDILDITLASEEANTCEQLVYLANLRGGDDNITVVLVTS